MTLPFVLDAKTGTVQLRLDPKPQSKTWAEGGGIWGQIEALIANLVLLFLKDSIAALAGSIAHALHRMNTGNDLPVAWRGQPAFRAGTAALVDCVYFAEAPA